MTDMNTNMNTIDTTDLTVESGNVTVDVLGQIGIIAGGVIVGELIVAAFGAGCRVIANAIDQSKLEKEAAAAAQPQADAK